MQNVCFGRISKYLQIYNINDIILQKNFNFDTKARAKTF